MSLEHKPRIAIVGAGIAGLVLAIGLSHLIPDIQVDIYEQARELKEVGVGFAFWQGRTWEILERIGADKALAELLPKDKKPSNERKLVWRVVNSDEGKMKEIFELYRTGGINFFHRAAAQKTLLECLPPQIKIHLAHRLVSYTESDEGVQLTFHSQPPISCELVIAADGIHSNIRKEFIEKRFPEHLESVKPFWEGSIAYRSLISTDRVQEKYPNHPSLSTAIVYTGKGKSAITYPILHGKFMNIVVFVTDFSKNGTRFNGPSYEPVDKNCILDQFEGWSEEFTILLQSIDSCSAWAIQYVTGLPSFAVGRVALMGDAAHAMAPNLAAGAGQAVEDAYILANLISKCIQDNIPIPRVTEAYSKVRQPITNKGLKQSHNMSRMAAFCLPEFESFNDEDEKTRGMLLKRYIEKYKELHDWWAEFPLEKEVEEAISLL